MNNVKTDSFVVLRALTSVDQAASARSGFGCAAIDARIGGGVMLGALHEFIAGDDDLVAATAVSLMLATRLIKHRPLLWLRADRAARRGGFVEASGLIEIGLAPDNVILVQAIDANDLAKAALDAMRCDQVGAVLLESVDHTGLGLTETRRLTHAARVSGVTLFTACASTQTRPSAAWTRWHVASAPSAPLPSNAPGPPTFDLDLLRDRGGSPPFTIRLEWNRDRRAFDEASLSGGMAAVPRSRTRPQDDKRAA